MEVRVVYLEGCSATPKTISLIEEVAQDLGISIRLESVVVKTQEDAERFRHIGSPTVQINGLDIDKGARDIHTYALT